MSVTLARRRVLKGERIDNSEKLFQSVRARTLSSSYVAKFLDLSSFGDRVLVIEDGAGFVCDDAILPRKRRRNSEVLVEEMKQAGQQRLNGRIRRALFDRGFHFSGESTRVGETGRAAVLCPSQGHVQAQRQEQEATVEIRQARRRHPGIESAIGALQSGYGLDSGVEIRTSAATVGTWDWGSLVGIFRSWESC